MGTLFGICLVIAVAVYAPEIFAKLTTVAKAIGTYIVNLWKR